MSFQRFPASTPTPNPSSLQSHISTLQPSFSLDALCNPSMVQIILMNYNDIELGNFSVMRELICARSAYFKATFTGRFAEAESQSIILIDVPIWVFQCFLRWVYTQQLSLLELTVPLDDKMSWERDEIQNADPATWTWQMLTDLYVFADKYDSRTFRMLLFEAIQAKLALAPHTRPTFPGPKQLSLIVSSLPSSSPLRRLLLDYRLHLKQRPHEPAEFRSELLNLSIRCDLARACPQCRAKKPCAGIFHSAEDGVPCLHKTWCFYHEHDGQEEERRLCEWRRQSMKEKFAQRENNRSRPNSVLRDMMDSRLRESFKTWWRGEGEWVPFNIRRD